jgi:hypothetical protein
MSIASANTSLSVLGAGAWSALSSSMSAPSVGNGRSSGAIYATAPSITDCEPTAAAIVACPKSAMRAWRSASTSTLA